MNTNPLLGMLALTICLLFGCSKEQTPQTVLKGKMIAVTGDAVSLEFVRNGDQLTYVVFKEDCVFEPAGFAKAFPLGEVCELKGELIDDGEQMTKLLGTSLRVGAPRRPKLLLASSAKWPEFKGAVVSVVTGPLQFRIHGAIVPLIQHQTLASLLEEGQANLATDGNSDEKLSETIARNSFTQGFMADTGWRGR